MDGVCLAHEQLRVLFMGRFKADLLGFRPLLPAGVDAEIKPLSSQQELWHTLAEWQSGAQSP